MSAQMTNGKVAPQSSGATSMPPKDDPVAEARAAAEETGAAAKDRAESLGETAKAEAGRLAREAKAAAETRTERAKLDATARIDETAGNIRDAGRQFGADSYQAQAADYLADNLMHAADRIRAQDLDSIAHDASDFARRNPAVVLGGAALLGFAAARLLKASSRGGPA
ncbi:hypothetical protein [Jannaschia marina]|uniref:hypothetical protein n=1 Tax=Jannaschia marina TaxID=2741674 RepID=UPI0015CE2AB6|nr:hypothetical protein [Jannaschia marina]